MQSIVLNGTYSAIPYIVYALCAIPSGQVADFLRATFRIPTGVVRKLFTTACEFMWSYMYRLVIEFYMVCTLYDDQGAYRHEQLNMMCYSCHVFHKHYMSPGCKLQVQCVGSEIVE